MHKIREEVTDGIPIDGNTIVHCRHVQLQWICGYGSLAESLKGWGAGSETPKDGHACV